MRRSSTTNLCSVISTIRMQVRAEMRLLRYPGMRGMALFSFTTAREKRPPWRSCCYAREGARTRMEGGILGETDPGTLFDIWDEGTATPESWRFVNVNTVSYHQSRVNLLGIYAVIKHALQSTAGTGQKSPMDFIETAAATRLGMPLPAALGLFRGEFATMQTSA